MNNILDLYNRIKTYVIEGSVALIAVLMGYIYFLKSRNAIDDALLQQAKEDKKLQGIENQIQQNNDALAEEEKKRKAIEDGTN